MDESEDPNAGGKRVSLITMINKSNKNYPVGEKQTGRLDRAGHRRHLTFGNEPTRNCKHREILKGANEEGNEGKQLV